MQTVIAAPRDFTAITRQTPDKIALSLLTLSGAERWSYAKLLDQTEALALQMPQSRQFVLEPQSALTTPVAMAAALKAGLEVVFEQPPEAECTGPDLPLEAGDRIFLAGGLDDPLLLRAVMLAWAAGATVLFPSPNLVAAQWPILMRRHDVTLLAGRSAALTALLAANLPPLPKLRASFTLDTPSAMLQEEWASRMGARLARA